MTDYVGLVLFGIIIVILVIIIQYLMNPYWNRLGLGYLEGEENRGKSEEEKKKEEEFYREIWKGRKKSENKGSD